MFSKRRRAASNPPQRAAPPPSASAALAATTAFVRNQASDANLSNAAAAAALRSHTSSPIPVGDVVTKRMVRRGSTSSQGSQRPQGLRRQSSAGSMTERSFRNASPGRGSPVAVPPVPAVPRILHGRAASLEPVHRRGASPTQRGGGAGGGGGGGGGGGRGDSGAGPSANAGSTQRVGSPLAQVSEEGQDQRQSINFSRPMSPALSVTAGGPSATHAWFTGPVVDHEAVQRMASTSQPKKAAATTRPASTHQLKPAGTAAQSRSFLPATSPSPRPVDPKSPDAVYDPSTRTFIHKQDAMHIHREQHQQPDDPAHRYVAQHLHSAAPMHAARARTPSPLRYTVQPEQSPPPSVAQPLLPEPHTAADTPRYEERPISPPPSHPRPAPAPALARQRPEDYTNTDIKPVDLVPIDLGQANTHQEPESDLSPRFTPNKDSAYPRIGSPPDTASNPRVEQVRGHVRTERPASLSPARHATFAPTTIEFAGLKHEPLPRSVSPAKSALKSSPSVSRRSNSPLAPNGLGFAKAASVSGASDTASESGYGNKKKKTVRVSFEQEPVLAGHSAYGDMDAPSSPAGPTPYQPIAAAQTEDEFEDFMKPRPALPSFGSVRDKTRPRDEDDVPQKVTETVSTPMSASVASVGEPMEASTDLGLAHIVAQDFASQKTATGDPLPPQLASVEGSGYASDSNYSTDGESSMRKHADPATAPQTLPVPEPKSLTKPAAAQPSTLPIISEQVVQVPNIAVLPATPSPYEHAEPRFQSMSAPGGWNDEEEQQPVASAYAPVQFAPIQTPASFQQQLSEPPSSPGHDGDTSDDDSSVYSDAYEDVSDMEGGFGSINAIVESPVIGSTPSPGLMNSKYADKSVTESPTPQSKSDTPSLARNEPVDQVTRDWEAARAHWSGVNRPRDHDDAHATQSPAHVESVAARVLQAPVQEEQLRAQHKPTVQPATRAVAETRPRVSMSQAPPKSSVSAQPTQTPDRPLKSALKKSTPSPAPAQKASGVPQMRTSMRGASPRDASSGQTQMRSTMRGNASPGPRAAPQMRTSMRGNGPAPTTNMALAASRQSVPVDPKPPRGALQKKHIPAGVAASQARPQSLPAPAPRKATAPAPTYDSDSDASASSFQRSRARRNNAGGFARTSMRGGPSGPTMRAAAPAPAQVRSISPSRVSQSTNRPSMRPSSPTPEPAKSSRFSIRSLSPGGRFRKKPKDEPPMPALPRSVPKPATVSRQPKGKTPAPARSSAFKSRFVDSSDEDEARPSRFTSRFEDSDSEPEPYELPPDLTPVRGIPRKAGEEDGDSTDLEEEAEAPKPSASAPANAAVTNGHGNDASTAQGTALAAGSLRDSKHAPSSPETKTKRGFFGMGKKKTAPAPPPAAAQTARPPTSDIPLPPQPRNREIGGPLTPIGEDEDKELGASPPAITASPQAKQSPRAPKLQRRSTPEWPLAPPPPITGEQRPMSSDGVAQRPRFGKRQSSQISTATSPVLDAQGRSVSFGRTGKKKKFQGLRRVFGIND
ncbi:uncharacterized protein EKO05_0000030 [Ascochyta rabiei]|uniref:uncharacterized protein n=1 Tax=Didymella rabiei TaxID=5454 RepID=UPI0018FFA876|nr:uncharacterized protein EKO05_0000030 [Ascochyta rabiei]UPX09339.1 hypothetical protein EKO05_0000030 [Ascochyta rabiei]